MDTTERSNQEAEGCRHIWCHENMFVSSCLKCGKKIDVRKVNVDVPWRVYHKKGGRSMKIDITQEELDALIRHLEAILARYESEAGVFFAVEKDCLGAHGLAVSRLEAARSAETLLDKLLHI